MTKIFHVKACVTQGTEIALYNGRGHALISDQIKEQNPCSGPTPLELCIMSHAGCYATTCASAAQKMRLPLKGCEVKIDAVKTEEAGTITEETIDITLDIEAPADRIQRLHEVTLKNCPIGILLDNAGVKITYNLKIKDKIME